MKNFLKHALFVLCVFSMVLGFVGCPQEPEKGSDPVISISIASTGYTAGSFMVGDEATLTATVVNSTKPVIWTVEPAGIVSIPSSGAEIKMLALAKGTAVVTAKVGDKATTFPVVVDVNPAEAELKELPWAVTMGKGFGNNDVFTKSIDDAGHGTWYTNNSLIKWDGIGYYGAANGYQYYAEYEGVWFNWYASANTEIGNVAGGRLESYMAILKDSLKAAEGKNVKITINAKAILKAENEGDEPKQPRLALYTQDKYVLADTDLTEEAKNYEFVVAPGQQIVIGNNGPTGSYMVILGVSAEETDAEAIDQTPSINSVTVTLPAEVQVGGTTSATAEVSVKYNADKTVEWKSSDETIATVDAKGNVTGVAAGTATITATSTVDGTKADSKEIAVITGELKPQVGETYVYSFLSSPITEGAVNLSSLLTAEGAEGASPDTFISWDNGIKLHSGGYGVNTTAGSIKIKVAGDSVISWAGSAAYGGGIIDVLDAEGNVLYDDISSQALPGEKVYGKGFIYKGDATTLTIAATSGTVYFSEITIKPWVDEEPAVTNISIAGLSSIAVGGTAELTATVSGDYYPTDFSVDWSSSDESLATVDENGVVTGVANGTVIIKATSKLTPSVSGSKEITIEEASGSIDAMWDFTSEYAANAVSINGATGTVVDPDTNLALEVDATTGKLASRGGDAQFNTGAIIKVPVSVGSVVTIVSYPSYYYYTVNGEAATADETVVTATEAGYVEIVATNTAYLYKISVTGYEVPKAIDAMWDFTSEYAANAVSINGATGTVVDPDTNLALEVDATTGKLASRGGDAQFNTGAIIKVPVSVGSVVTIVSYPSYYYYTVNGEAATADETVVTATEAGYVEIVATNTAYLYSIKVEGLLQ